jgi:tRNA(fMet)-specific endonuclease VapC
VTQRYMIDTNTVSYNIKGTSRASRATLAGLQHDEIACISVITEAELNYGLAKSPNAKNLRPAIEGFLGKGQILPWGRDEGQAYGRLRAIQEAAGETLGSLDMLIAAHAVSIGAILVTNDKAFSHVPNLSGFMNWATDR